MAYFRNFKKISSKTTSKNRLYIFDLDNTLANTYPYLKMSKNMYDTYANLPEHSNMLGLVKEVLDSGDFCIFLTAREYKYKSATIKWLKKKLNKKQFNLFIVPTAGSKLKYIDFAIKIFESVIFYDDMSYNHENGDIKFYDNEISYLKNLPITYYGYKEINSINNV